MPRQVAAFLCAAVSLTAAGCGTAPDDSATGPLTVYVSAPLSGEDAGAGRDVADGARLALADAGGTAGEVEVELEVLDAADGPGAVAGWSPEAVGRNARAAAQDTSATAYIGDLESGATRVSLPITNQAFVPQVSPGATALDLAAPPDGGTEVPEDVQPSGERTFLRVIPDDGVQAEAAAAWARDLGAERIEVISDGSSFGEQMAEEFSEAAEGLATSERTLDGPGPLDLGAAAPGPPDFRYAAGADPDLLPAPRGAGVVLADLPQVVLGSDALLMHAERLPVGIYEGLLRLTASAQAPEQLPPAGREFAAAFEREYGRAPGPYAAYGYEAMALVLDAVERAGADAEDRQAVLDELLATRDRDSVLGAYSITAIGNTTLEAIAGYRIRDGGPVFDQPLSPP